MGNFKKLMMASAGGDVVNVEDVFSNNLYYGSNTSNTITNGLDLSGEGGLVWTKRQNSYSYQSDFHHWFDTVRGASKILYSNETAVEATDASVLSSFNSDGFTLGSSSRANQGAEQYASWAFRQHPKFFQIKTFSTTYNTDPSYLTHDLECDLGVAIFKSRDNASQSNNWIVWHKDSPSNSYFRLNTTTGFVQDNSNPIGYNAGTKTFTFNYPMTVAGDRMIAGNQETTNWVGYFFAHNNNDGEFGASGDQDIIKCGKYTGNGSSDGPIITLGFEPQWLLIKRVNSSDNWALFDKLRGMSLKGVSGDNVLNPNTNAPSSNDQEWVQPLGDGFQLKSTNSNASGNDYIYIAIRNGMKAPESASDVFEVTSRVSPPAYKPPFISGFGPVDFFMERKINATHDWHTMTRATNKKRVMTNSSSNQINEAFYTITNTVESTLGISSSFTGTDANEFAWMWKKAEGFFDSVGWNGNSTFGRTISHNLGVVPEMIWVKCRSHNEDWYVYHKDIDVNSDNQPWTDYIKLNSYVGAADGNIWADTAPTDSVFSVGNQSYMNATNRTYLSYLFATSPGVSKVGSYTGTTASQIIDCGFTAGARFLLIKPLSSGYYWFIFDVERGITTTSNDGAMYLSASQQQYTESYALGYNAIEPDNSGFKLPSNNATNKNGENYIFYAIA
jgi:hypothetical protein